MWPDPIGRRPCAARLPEIYLRWERDLKPNGFRLAAPILDFPDGIPGDIGLFLTWGQ
jgi:hypothetical protein